MILMAAQYSGSPDDLLSQHMSAASGSLVSDQPGPQHIQPARRGHEDDRGRAGGVPLATESTLFMGTPDTKIKSSKKYSIHKVLM